MKILSAIAVAGSMVALLMLGSTESLSQDTCTSSGNHTIQVRADDNDVPVLSYGGGSADEVHVCIGDTIKWVLNGPNRTYFIDFLSSAPFEGATRRGSNSNVVSVVVGGPAQRGSSYKYDVVFQDGGTLDPRIVVD
jgi:hypothetical protein